MTNTTVTDQGRAVAALTAVIAHGGEFHDGAWFADRINKGKTWVRDNAVNLPRHKIGRSVRYCEGCVAEFAASTLVSPVRPGSTRTRRRRHSA